MPVIITSLANGEALTASRLNSIFEEAQDYLNGNLEEIDISTTAQITEEEIVSPEFYGSPAPRALLATSDVHYRREFDSTRTQIYTNQMTRDFVPIPMMSASFFCETDCNAIVTANFYAQESILHFGGSATQKRSNIVAGHPTDELFEVQSRKAAEFKLFVNDSSIAGTTRVIYNTGYDSVALPSGTGQIGALRYARPPYGNFLMAKNLSICTMVKLQAGQNDISVRVKPLVDYETGNYNRMIGHIYVEERQMSIEALIK